MSTATSHSHSHSSHPSSWWKAKLKDDAGGADGQVGLVPATYVEEVRLFVHLQRCAILTRMPRYRL